MIFFLKLTFIVLLLSMRFAMLAYCSDSDSDSGSLIRIHRHPQLQQMVRDHHLQTAKLHSIKGIQLSRDALEKGADRSVELNLHALVDSCECRHLDAASKIATARRTSLAGCAGCLHASITSGKNTIKHLYKSITQPKKVRTDDQHFERVRHDNRQLREDYRGMQDQIDYISQHH
ncbi:uncharacterized protein FA14DRAFT_23513 [Meira miltonrushii]|uniref:Uncharacterized protein n=1 Tax=Meira miltonrushii TaxID=1280837 RepID=A0A316VRN3_9BASI|nr:uncharacterized protein FA14DRAFT_23513 [Meira miltonrushii]PWN38155.1 hypothetical protein FA14DRAFT_23513 [Meira miltonrushii]